MEHSRARLMLKLVKDKAEHYSVELNNSDTNTKSEVWDLEREDGKPNTPDENYLHSTDVILLGATGTIETESPLKDIDINIIHGTADTTRLRSSTIPGDFENHVSLYDFSTDDSLKDPHYSVSSSSASSCSSTSSSSDSSRSFSDENDNENQFHGGMPNENVKQGRRRKATLESIKDQAKRLRNMGKAYLSNSRKNKKVVGSRKKDGSAM